MTTIQIKRAYEPFEQSDGFRILVDRLWPRGIKKQELHLDSWLKEIAPSSNLRKWFHHDLEKWDEFRKKYFTELKRSTALEILEHYCKEKKKITLLYGAKDKEHNQAVVLKEFLEELCKDTTYELNR